MAIYNKEEKTVSIDKEMKHQIGAESKGVSAEKKSGKARKVSQLEIDEAMANGGFIRGGESNYDIAKLTGKDAGEIKEGDLVCGIDGTNKPYFMSADKFKDNYKVSEQDLEKMPTDNFSDYASRNKGELVYVKLPGSVNAGVKSVELAAEQWGPDAKQNVELDKNGGFFVYRNMSNPTKPEVYGIETAAVEENFQVKGKIPSKALNVRAVLDSVMLKGFETLYKNGELKPEELKDFKSALNFQQKHNDEASLGMKLNNCRTFGKYEIDSERMKSDQVYNKTINDLNKALDFDPNWPGKNGKDKINLVTEITGRGAINQLKKLNEKIKSIMPERPDLFPKKEGVELPEKKTADLEIPKKGCVVLTGIEKSKIKKGMRISNEELKKVLNELIKKDAFNKLVKKTGIEKAKNSKDRKKEGRERS